MHRFFAPAMDPGDETVMLPRDEAEHLRRVLRLGVGDTVAVFDGRGHECLARVASLVRRDVVLQLLSRVEPAEEPSVALTLVQAVIKGDKMDDVIRDAVMLGAAAIQPVVTHRSEATVAALLNSKRVDRWRRVAIASTKQSRRAVVPEIRMPLSLDTYLAEPAPALRLLLVEPSIAGGHTGSRLSDLQKEPAPHDAAVMIGPEGGWTEKECQAALAHGVRPITLGSRTLRADAVPVVAIALLQYLWGDL